MMKPGSGDHPDNREAEQQAHRQKKRSLSKNSHAGLLNTRRHFSCSMQEPTTLGDERQAGTGIADARAILNAAITTRTGLPNETSVPLSSLRSKA